MNIYDLAETVTGTALPTREWLWASTTETAALVGDQLIDWAAVERALNGQLSAPWDVTEDERYVACRMLAQRGPGARETAQRTLTVERRVHRWSAAGWPEERPTGVCERQARAKVSPV